MKWIYTLVFALGTVLSFGQTAPDYYYIRFSDKEGTPYSLDNPQAFLSQKSIQRRIDWGIPLEWKDLPVNPNYVEEVLSVGSCSKHHVSKWFNSMTLKIEDTLRRQEILDFVNALPFVLEVRDYSTDSSSHSDKLSLVENRDASDEFDIEDEYQQFYGPSYRQVSMINAHVLHELGFTGEGIQIALFDAGWNLTDQLSIFEKLRDEGRLLGTRDFVFTNENNVFNRSNHGTFVLSTVGGFMPDSLIGTAPDASYYLFRTENPESEYLIEEDNWVAAAEYADSLGVDIINSSLGYSRFDDPTMDHTYADMDGNTTRSAIAGDIAASKGILVVNSAGNSGHQPWFYITSPSDGDSVLCVGAVNANAHRAFFSSFGPAADGDVKPNVMAMGQATVFADLDGTIRTGNGTSFSSPIMAGGAALLLQATKGRKTNMEIFRAIEASAHRYNYPSDSLGYGIPDLWKALLDLNEPIAQNLREDLVVIFPNPATDRIHIAAQWLQGLDQVEYDMYDITGRKVLSGKSMLTAGPDKSVVTITWPEAQFTPGEYFIELRSDKETRRGRVVVR